LGSFFEIVADEATKLYRNAKPIDPRATLQKAIWQALGSYEGDRTKAFRAIQKIIVARSGKARQRQKAKASNKARWEWLDN
jgi:hypothetical protein